ncbi:DUF397 domain-containing protein [Streptomyces parvus]|uniref:DUF397 domain-containing protein n=1 Tax=Streptomyces parvus TaxID=66428 RepID=UPI00123AD9DA|nr:DUF397 domain-containing protein [Streptomyces parvus]KAA6204001.1 DUF397 domain-containing protein [Streptomyces parvus]GGS49971.1 hypothetical protein GCM10010221_56350 [Streptomyces parvus]
MARRTIPTDFSPTRWRKSSYSGSESGSCLEVQDHHPTAVPVRDSKVPGGPALLIPAAGWTSFVDAVKRGVFSA